MDRQEDSEAQHPLHPWFQDNLLEFFCEQEALAKENLSFFKKKHFSLFGGILKLGCWRLIVPCIFHEHFPL